VTAPTTVPSSLTIGGISTPLGTPGLLRVILVSRQSTPHQKSLSAQQDLLGKWLHETWAGRLEIVRDISTTESGGVIARSSFHELLGLVEDRAADLVLAPETSRITRHQRGLGQLLDLAIDCGVRLYTIHDHFDSADPDSAEIKSMLYGYTNSKHNADKSKQIRTSQNKAFLAGEYFPTPGWPLHDDKSIPSKKVTERLQIIPGAAEIVLEVYDRIESGEPIASVVDDLNARGLRNETPGQEPRPLTVALIRRGIQNPAITGLLCSGRERNHYERTSGEYRREPASRAEWLTLEVPRLKIIEPERQEAMRLFRGLKRTDSPRTRRGRRSGRPALWPSMHVLCGICGRPYPFLGNAATPGKHVKAPVEWTASVTGRARAAAASDSAAGSDPPGAVVAARSRPRRVRASPSPPRNTPGSCGPPSWARNKPASARRPTDWK
jgi:DNA invertase Pin-like site-specific DNA recombinase